MSHFQQVAGRVEGAWPVASWSDVNVLVAVSGGADSVALLRVLARCRDESGGDGSLAVAHFNHRVRGPAAEADAAWVADLAAGLGLVCEGGASREAGPRTENTLRDERRAYLTAAAERVGARYVVTAHTADDQAETVLFRLLRGSGLDGLRGIPAVAELTPSVTLVRPLLGVRRAELRTLLSELGQSFREDATNDDTAPTRNWLRHDLLPMIERRFADPVAALTRLAEQAAEAEQAITVAGVALLERARRPHHGGGVEFDARALAAEPRAVAVAALRQAWRDASWGEGAMTAEHWRSLAAMASGASAARGGPPAIQLPGGIDARRVDDRLRLTAPSPRRGP